MIFRKIRSEGLSHNSYFIADGISAAVIDPRRDCQEYLDIASASDPESRIYSRRTGTRIMYPGRSNYLDEPEPKFTMVQHWTFLSEGLFQRATSSPSEGWTAV